MTNDSTNRVNSATNAPQFYKLTAERVKQDYVDGLITAEAYILYLLDIHSFGNVGWSIDATEATSKWNIPKRTYYRAIEKLKSSGKIKISNKTARVHGINPECKLDSPPLMERKYSAKRRIKYRQFLKSEYWMACRDLVLARDNYACQSCGGKTNLQVHHLTYSHHKDEMNHLDDLVTLCKQCHKKEHQL
jgi:hypothetical protein